VIASLNGSAQATSIVLNLAPQSVIASLSCLPDPVTAGALNCAIQLTQAAPAGGAFVALQSNSSRLQVPQQIPIPAGQQSATFPIRVLPSDQDEQPGSRCLSRRSAHDVAIGNRHPANCPHTLDTAIQAGNWLDGEILLNSSNVPDFVSLALASSSPNLRIPSFITTRPGRHGHLQGVRRSLCNTAEHGIVGQFGHTAVRTPIA